MSFCSCLPHPHSLGFYKRFSKGSLTLSTALQSVCETPSSTHAPHHAGRHTPDLGLCRCHGCAAKAAVLCTALGRRVWDSHPLSTFNAKQLGQVFAVLDGIHHPHCHARRCPPCTTRAPRHPCDSAAHTVRSLHPGVPQSFKRIRAVFEKTHHHRGNAPLNLHSNRAGSPNSLSRILRLSSLFWRGPVLKSLALSRKNMQSSMSKKMADALHR
jgi:hypothetical protein